LYMLPRGRGSATGMKEPLPTLGGPAKRGKKTESGDNRRLVERCCKSIRDKRRRGDDNTPNASPIRNRNIQIRAIVAQAAGQKGNP